MSFENYEILGRQIVSELQHGHVVGAAPATGGFDPSFLIDAASELTKGGISSYQSSQASDAANKAAAAAAAKSVSADAGWAAAERDLDIAHQSGNAQQIASATALESAMKNAAAATAAGLTPAAQQQRAAAATKAVQNAASDSLASPNDNAKAATMRAWQLVAAQVAAGAALAPNNPAAPGSALAKHVETGGNFFVKNVGGVPVWGWTLGGAAVLTGVVLLLRRR